MNQNEAGLRLRLGIIHKVLEPGLHFKIPFVDTFWIKPTKIECFRVYQTLITKDNVVTEVGLTCLYRIADIKLIYLSFRDDYVQSMDEFANFTLNKLVTNTKFNDLLKDSVTEELMIESNRRANEYGINILSIAVTDIKPNIIEMIKFRFGDSVIKLLGGIKKLK